MTEKNDKQTIKND